MARQTDTLAAALTMLLRPLLRICLRQGLSIKALVALIKHVTVTLARDEFGVNGKPATASRIAILTGLTRKDVQRLLDTPHRDMRPELTQYNRAASVIGGWLTDPAFSNAKGHPAPLVISGGPASFAELVRRYSGDMPARAMLDELVRVGAIQALQDGRICLRARGYVPEKCSAQKLAILGADTADLIATIDHNLQHAPRDPRFQRKVMYDNVPEAAAEEFRAIAAARGQELLESLDRWLAHRDRDVNPAVTGHGRRRVGIGVYHFEEPVAPPRSESST